MPQLCLLCGISCGNLSQRSLQRSICAECDAAYWNEPRLRCVSCALPLGNAQRRDEDRYRCGNCAGAPPPFDATLALGDYRAPLERLAVGLKFRARLAIAREFALRLARVADDSLERKNWPDVVTPVPLARKRLIERGFNQAWEIAKPLARALDVPANPTLLQRVACTAPQSRLDLDARRRNVAAAFRVEKPVRGLHIALVDDVMTSGATLEAAAHALKAAGARRVTNFVALRTPKD
ncbi:MAG TPA: ComF family protein [Trinickia sp.]|nr:ComF family protein [Trinickia sp.]